jgi:hypothetical protein
MSDDDDNEEESQSWADWFEETIGMWITIAVIGASVAVPVAMWVASEYFGWEPPEFIQDWIDFFSA